jgi:lipopolysaccharide assembly outer membrane protein LptD (OstA)
MTWFRLSLLFLIILSVGSAQAQPTTIDTVKAQMSLQDTSKHNVGAGVDTVVNYSARDSIIYSLGTRYMYLYGKSELQYQTIGLRAERVNINWDNATLLAHGVSDTAKVDTVIGKPIMRDGGDEYRGDQVTYNFRTRKGKITIGNTHMDNGYYVGEQIKKLESGVLCVANGTYTTCDIKEPHFHFESPKMKVFVRDKVVAEPVYFYVAGVPIFALPFGVFPAHGGRSSGLIAPAYGEDNTYGWYLSHLGYFWAVSDYWDVATMFDVYSRGRWRNQTNIRYTLRYVFGGSLSAQIASTPEGEPSDPNYNKTRDYYVNLTHGQQISPSSRLDVNFTFTSRSYLRSYSVNYSDILTQNIISYASYSKSWEASNRSLGISLFRDQSLITDETRERLPSVSFSQGTFFPFRHRTKSRGLTTGPETESSIIEMLGFNYGMNFSNDRSKLTDIDTVKLNPSAQRIDSVKNFRRTNTQFLSQNLSFSISPKLGYITVSPSLSLSDSRSWTQAVIPSRNPVDSLLMYQTEKSKITQGYLNTGISTSTRFYGIFQPNLLNIKAIRHTVLPTFTLYYNKQIYGDNMQKYSMVGSLNIGNIFEMKYQKSDSARTEDKLQLLNLSASTSYDFAADSMNFRDVSVSYRTNIGQYLDISGGATYNLYVFDPTARSGYGARVNRFLLKENGKFGDMTSFSLSLSSSFSGEKKQKPSEAGIPDKVIQEQALVSGEGMTQPGQRKRYYSIYDREDADFSIPWKISFSYNFFQYQPTPRSYSRSSSLSASLSFNLTEKWQIATSGSYDFVRKQHVIPSLSITRDLHCWEMSFSWFPMGILEGYRFELKVKAPQLQDIKVTKQSNNTVPRYYSQ